MHLKTVRSAGLAPYKTAQFYTLEELPNWNKELRTRIIVTYSDKEERILYPECKDHHCAHTFMTRFHPEIPYQSGWLSEFVTMNERCCTCASCEDCKSHRLRSLLHPV